MHGGESLVPGQGVPANWKIFNFRNLRSGWFFFDLPYSAFATPSRYLAEMVRRLSRDDPKQKLLLFNPWIELGRAEVALVLQQMRHATEGPVIVADRNGIPVAYLLAANDVSELRMLTLLSCVDAELDARLLGILMERKVTSVRDPVLDIGVAVGNGYSSHPMHRRIMCWMAEHALAAVVAHTRSGKAIPPIFAVLPYHAGDILFFALAHRRTLFPFVDGVVVERRFEEVVRAASPSLPYRVLNLERIRSDGEIAWENRQFDAIRAQLRDDLLYYYCRPLRPYDVSEYHLIDQYAFAVGHDGRSPLVREEGTVFPVCLDNSVLLHFDGGWPLKVYPVAWRRRLIELLVERGCRITTLTNEPDADFSTHRNVRFTDLGALKSLIEQHSILVGMDSFPCHYAAHVLNVPTICLFASTQPANSDAVESSRYMALEMGLPCRPCGAWSICPRNGSAECGNFVTPEKVAEAIKRVLDKQRTAI